MAEVQEKIQNDIDELIDTLNALSKVMNRMADKDFSSASIESGFPGAEVVIHALDKMRNALVEMFVETLGNSYSLLSAAGEMTGMTAEMMERARVMNDKSVNVADATSHMSENMNTVSAAAEEMSVNMSTVSERAGQSSQNIMNVSAAIEEMTATITEIAHNAEQARQIVEHAVSSVNSATERMNELSKAATGINFVTASISGISDQTKLLALNATIEAARAGEAGTRFGVVAREVKALAGETNKATKEIQDKVGTMQSTSRAALDEIRKINDVMREVNEIVATIATSVEEQSATAREISSNVNYAANGISDMSNAVGEAAIAVQEVTTNITQAAQLAGQVADDIEDVSRESTRVKDDSTILYASAMEVDSHGHDLTRLVEMFKLPSDVRIDRKGHKVLFKFSEPFSVQVHDLDEEHKGIFDYINKIHKAIKERKTAGEILPILKDLYEWTTNHFAHEEELMKKVQYKDYDAQKRAHTKLLDDVNANIQKIERNEDINLIQLMIFLKDWLVSHIMGMDKKYSEPMNRNGIH